VRPRRGSLSVIVGEGLPSNGLLRRRRTVGLILRIAIRQITHSAREFDLGGRRLPVLREQRLQSLYLRPVVDGNIRSIWMPLEVILMIRLGRIERSRGSIRVTIGRANAWAPSSWAT